MQLIFLTLSSILIVIAPTTYIISIVQGKSRPHRMTRFILAFVLGLNFFSVIAANGNKGAQLFAGIVFFQAVIILFMSLWRGIGGIGIFDWMCLFIAILGILGWKLTGNPVISIWFAVVADFSACLPALMKTLKYPGTESAWYYFLGGIAAILSLFTYRFDVSSVFQIYIAFSCLLMIGAIYHKKILRII